MIILEQTNSLFNHFIGELRDTNVQTDRLRFRTNLNRIGEIFAYEISKTLSYSMKDITTPLGVKTLPLSNDRIILCSVLRAGLPLHDGILRYFDHADNAFISAYRKHYDDGHVEIRMDYVATPLLEESTLIICDPMLATGASLLASYQALMKIGKPKKIHIVSVIASKYAVDYLQKSISDDNCTLWVGSIDDELNSHSYIVPGLGDAGDLAFGPKIQN